MIILHFETIFVCLSCTGMCLNVNASWGKSGIKHRLPPLLGNPSSPQWPPSELTASGKYTSYRSTLPMLSKSVFWLLVNKLSFEIKPFRRLYEVLIDKTGEIFIGHWFYLDFGSDLLQNYWIKAIGPSGKQKERYLPYKLKKESSRLVR